MENKVPINLKTIQIQQIQGFPVPVRNDKKKSQLIPLNQTWQKNGLKVLFYIQKAMLKFLALSSQYKFRNIRSNQFQIIGDKSSNFNYFQMKNLVSSKMNFYNLLGLKLRQLKNRFFKGYSQESWIIKPDSTKKLYQNIIYLNFYFTVMLMIPIKIAFDSEISDSNYKIFENAYDIIIILFLMTEMFLNFITAYYQKGELIMKQRKVFLQYLQGDFTYDGLIFILFFIGQTNGIMYLQISPIFKLFKMNDLLKQILENFQLTDKLKAVFDLLKLAFTLLIVAHICGCVFYKIGNQQMELNSNEITWITKLQLQNKSWLEKYVSSLYWAVVTMVTLGYGDIVPISIIQKGFVIFMALINCGVFGYSINNIGSIFDQLKEKDIAKSKKIQTITTFLTKRNIDHNILMKSKRYLEYIQAETQNDQEFLIIFQQLSSDLQQEIKRDIYFKLISKQKFFQLNFSQDFILELSQQVEEEKYGPDERILKQNEPNDKLFFLLSGNAELKISNNSIQKQKPGDVFGKQSFISDRHEELSVVSLNMVNVAYLSQAEFLATLRKYPDDYQKYCVLRDNLMINNNTRGLDMSCKSCESFLHEFFSCPYLSCIPNKQKLLYQEKHLKQEQRLPYKRREVRSERPMAIIDYLHEAASQILVNLNLDYYSLNELEECIDQIVQIRVEDQNFQQSLDSIFNDEQQLSKSDVNQKTIQTLSLQQFEEIKEGDGQINPNQPIKSFIQPPPTLGIGSKSFSDVLNRFKTIQQENSPSSQEMDSFDFTITDANDIDETPVPSVPILSKLSANPQQENSPKKEPSFLPSIIQNVFQLRDERRKKSQKQSLFQLFQNHQDLNRQPQQLKTEGQDEIIKRWNSDDGFSKQINQSTSDLQIKISPKTLNYINNDYEKFYTGITSNSDNAQQQKPIKLFANQITDSFDIDAMCNWKLYMIYNNFQNIIERQDIKKSTIFGDTHETQQKLLEKFNISKSQMHIEKSHLQSEVQFTEQLPFEISNRTSRPNLDQRVESDLEQLL